MMFGIFGKKKDASSADVASNRLREVVSSSRPQNGIQRLREEIKAVIAKFYAVKDVHVKVANRQVKVDAQIKT